MSGFRPRNGWGGPWRLNRKVTPPQWIRPLVRGGHVYIGGPRVKPRKVKTGG